MAFRQAIILLPWVKELGSMCGIGSLNIWSFCCNVDVLLHGGQTMFNEISALWWNGLIGLGGDSIGIVFDGCNHGGELVGRSSSRNNFNPIE